MAKKKIGDIGEGGTAISEGHAANSDSLKSLFLAMRAELDALYAKMDTDNTAQNAAVTGSQLDVDYAATLPQTEA
jgi:hypothetical protein